MYKKNKKVNWGVIGTAAIAEKQTLPAMLKAENANLYAIAGRNPDKVFMFTERFGFEKSYSSYNELLDDPNVDAVYIALPNHLHKEWIMKAAERKKHILCEKPVTPTLEDAKAVYEKCQEEGVLLMEGFAYLHSEIICSLTDCIRSGTIGEIKLIEAAFFINEPASDNIRLNKETYGGSLYDLGCYNISLILRIMDTLPNSVKAISYYTDHGVDGISSILMEFPGRAHAASVCGMCAGQRADRFFVYGTKGRIEAFIPYNADGRQSYTIVHKDETKTVQAEVTNNYQLELEQFGRCIQDKETPWVSEDFSIRVSEVLEKVLDEIDYKSGGRNAD